MYYPIHLNLLDMNIVVIGAGHIAARKCQIFCEYNKPVSVVSPQFCDFFLSRAHLFQLVTDHYQPSYIAQSQLVIAATNDPAVNRQIATDCKARGILVNVADSAELSSFIVPAYVKRGDLLLSVSTSGKDPATTKRIKHELEQTYSLFDTERLAQLGTERATRKGVS